MVVGNSISAKSITKDWRMNFKSEDFKAQRKERNKGKQKFVKVALNSSKFCYNK